MIFILLLVGVCVTIYWVLNMMMDPKLLITVSQSDDSEDKELGAEQKNSMRRSK